MKYSYEVVKYNKNIPGMILMQEKEGWRCRTEHHWHKEIEIVYMINGHLDIAINGRNYPINDGDLFFCNSEEIHITNVDDSDSVNKYLVVLISYDYIKKYLKKLDSVYFNVFDNQVATEKIKESMRQLVYIENNPKSDFDELTKNVEILRIIHVLLSECTVRKRTNFIEHTPDNFSYAKRVLEYVGENYRDDITLNDMASLVGLSSAYFSKYFKNITGTSFIQYLNGIRLEHAIKDMLTQNMSVSEAALENGFPNVKSFISMCKKVYGYTPAQYKKQYPEY